ncbi:MAG: 1-acyl-sn-glycerol-3-phosphate acyltransferase [Mediterranea sp.]|jgi:1-acyl-sn-glycerol-3-phosphate acyltransferase|nr:1-acyl-sn-glycerol-3-phosphate acyltransferase [Mediterranea sp.]
MKDPKFDDIRPYYEEEIPAAMQRIAESPFFPLLASYVYPEQNMETVREMLKSFRTIADFQLEVMRCVTEQVIAKSITGFSYHGVEQLDPGKRYLFVSNHRDIMLDSCLLQYILYKNGHETTEITFGSNLMSNPIVIDIGKSNKMFRVERGGSMKDFYKNALHLSEYIRHVLTEKDQSVWIAQRNGRTKDGNDSTDQGIIKMFCMSKPQDKIKALSELNIIPVSVSYEWESCDILKTLELYGSRHTKYIKKPGEDLNSILTGIIQPKGKVHIEFCRQLTEDDLIAFDGNTNNEYHKNVAALLDKRIHSGYHLTPNNYIAHDLRYGHEQHRSHYTGQQKQTFINYMDRFNAYEDCDTDALKDIFLSIYANPVNHKA